MKALIAGVLLAASAAYGSESAYEVCTPEGPCALRVFDTDAQESVWLVTEASQDLNLIWGGTFWLVDDQTYQDVLADVPERLTLPAINPTTGLTLERAKGGSTKGGSTSGGSTKGGSSSGSGSGPLIQTGNISIGGGNPCAPCHGGDMREIHKHVMAKPDNGK